MKVDDLQVRSIKAFVLGEFEEFGRIRSSFDSAERNINTRLTTAAFSEAVRRRFHDTSSARSEIVGFVSRARLSSPDAASIIDPATAESLLFSVVSDEPVTGIDGRTQGVYLTILLPFLVGEMRLTDTELDGLLGEAKDLLESWIQE